VTAFLLFDELERDFEPLESEPARHAAAVAMYSLVGQKCAQRMTDGLIPQQVIAKTFAAWPVAMVSAAIADLVALGQWEQDDSGGFRFVDWDLKQFTRDQEAARREKHAKRNRDYRARKKTADSDAVMHHVTRHEDSHVTVPSSSPSSSPEPKRESACAPGRAPLPHEPSASPKPSKPRDERKVLFAATLKAESKSAGLDSTPEVGGKVRDAAVRMAAEAAENTGRSFAECLRERIAGGIAEHIASGKPVQWAIKDWSPPRLRIVEKPKAVTHDW
jgi:hypothetical protein